MVFMKNKNPVVFALILYSARVFSPLLLFAGLSSGQTPPVSPKVSPTAVISNREREELARLREEKRIREQVQTDFDRSFSRTTMLLNVWLVILSLFPLAVIALFWLLRRVAIREIVARAMEELQGLEKLQSQLMLVKQDAENAIEEVRNISENLETEANLLNLIKP